MPGRDSRPALALMTAPLYAGPIAAGWSASSIQTLPIFAAVFFLMQLQLGRAAPQPVKAQVPALILLALVQISVVSLAYGGGALLALLTGPLPLPLWFPLALIGCSAALGAVRFRRALDDAAMLDLIDRVEKTLSTGAQPETLKRPQETPDD